MALENIVEYLDDQQLATPTGVAAPTVDDFTTLGLTTFGTGSDEETITNDNLASVLANLVTLGTSIDTTNSGTASVQGIDKAELTNALIALPLGARDVTVSNLALVDDDNDAANGVASMNQVLTAKLSSDLLPTDKVFLTVNGGTSIDVTDYVVNNELRYGHDEATVTLYKKSTELNGFTSYMVGVIPNGETTFQNSVSAKEIFIPTTDLIREGSYTYISAPSIKSSDLTGTNDLTLSANGSFIKASDTVMGYLIVDNPTVTDSGSTYDYQNGDLSFTLTISDSTIDFGTVPTPISGHDFFVEVIYANDSGRVSSELVSLTTNGTFTPTLPSGATTYTLGPVQIGLEMTKNSAGSYEAALADEYFNDIDASFTPFNVRVEGADGTVYAQDSALVGATYETAVSTLDYASINALSDGGTFSATVQVVDVPSATNLDVLSENASGTVVADLDKGSFVVSQNDELVVSVKDAYGNVVSAVTTSGDDTYDVDLSNPVDFLGIDINDDDDYADDYEVAVNGVVGNASSGYGAVDFWLDVSDASVDDVIGLYVDGQLIATSAALDQAAINAGTYHFTGDDESSTTTFDLNTKDDSATTGGDVTQGDDKAIIQLEVTNSSSTVVQSLTDTTWEYQW